jgi:hypothetical protein
MWGAKPLADRSSPSAFIPGEPGTTALLVSYLSLHPLGGIKELTVNQQDWTCLVRRISTRELLGFALFPLSYPNVTLLMAPSGQSVLTLYVYNLLPKHWDVNNFVSISTKTVKFLALNTYSL